MEKIIMQVDRTQVPDGALLSERSERSDAPSGGTVEIPAIVRRRQYTTAYKLHVLAQFDQCTASGQRAALARREGLYSSTISKWNEWRQCMQHRQGEEPSAPQAPSDKNDPRNELRKLERENRRLRLRLERAERIIELQKKVSALLESPSLDEQNDGNS
jgi:transposase-like protein